ncbi:hypothetical protein ACFFV7_46795 [Nonomuraea spiralis]|uniref:VCBS repeat-containing protein n=1 Tax=Nonomuraea spiralis TaxID=46182 RepID=A0ABV5IW14_9ACTN|nr:hypothetical protein [Nonomuraea spiralis]GGS84852.1 hypothetical protein GCM10010176_030720 [Nonomuraea spiralis]
MAAGDVHGTGRQQIALITSRTPGESPYLYLLDDLTPEIATRENSPRAWGALCNADNRDVLGCPKKDSRLAMGDVDGNGHVDLVMTNPSMRGIQIWARPTPPRPGRREPAGSS